MFGGGPPLAPKLCQPADIVPGATTCYRADILGPSPLSLAKQNLELASRIASL